MDACDLPMPDTPPRIPKKPGPDPSDKPKKPDPGDPPPPPPPPKVPPVPGMLLFDKTPAPPPPPGPANATLGDPVIIEPKGGARPPAASDGVDFPGDDPGSAAPYLSYACTTEYQYDSGMLQLPRAAAPAAAGTDEVKPSAALVRLHAPAGRRVVRYVAERAGWQPLVPEPEADGDNWTLLTARVMPEQPRPDGTLSVLIYRVSAEYVYAAARPRTPDQNFPAGVPAYSRLSDGDGLLRAEQFAGGIAPRD